MPATYRNYARHFKAGGLFYRDEVRATSIAAAACMPYPFPILDAVCVSVYCTDADYSFRSWWLRSAGGGRGLERVELDEVTPEIKPADGQ